MRRENEEPVPLRKGKLTRALLLVTLISAFGSSFQYGYNLSVIDSPAKFMQKFYREVYQERNTINIDQSLLLFQWGLTVLFFPLGGILGSLLAGPLVDGSGRKGTLLASSVVVIISAVLMGCSKAIHSHEFIILGRLIVGTCAGISFSVVPMYLTEMAPRNLRGALGSVPYIFIVCGSLVAHLFSLPKLLGTEEGWPVLLSLTSIPALFELATLPFFPESPRFLLIQRQDTQQARRVLKRLRGWDDVEDELEELRQEDLAEHSEKKMDVVRMLYGEELRWHLVTIVVLMAGQQLSGINAAQHYTERIYLSVGVEDDGAWYLRLLLLLLLALVALLVTWVIDSSGRRILLLVGNGVCGSACILTAMSVELQNNIRWMSYFSSSFDTLLLVGQAIGPGPVTSVLISELFLQTCRSTAFVIAGCTHWLCKFFIALTYLHVQSHIEPYSFLIFWPFCIATFTYVSKMIPETKGKTFLEIRRLVAIHRTRRMLLRDLANTN